MSIISKTKGVKITRGWPPARRKAQSLRCRAQKPWLHSTGPRTLAGKLRTRYNGHKHGMTAAHWRTLTRALKHQRDFINKIRALREEREQENTTHTRLPRMLSSLTYAVLPAEALHKMPQAG